MEQRLRNTAIYDFIDDPGAILAPEYNIARRVAIFNYKRWNSWRRRRLLVTPAPTIGKGIAEIIRNPHFATCDADNVALLKVVVPHNLLLAHECTVPAG
jgi:hypothetical protein